jgi:hypothetical protein
MAEAAGSGQRRHRLALAAARRGRARRLTGIWVFSSYSGWFSIRFAPTGSQRRGEHVYANLNRRTAATKPSNGEAAQLVLVDGEGDLWWSFGSKDVRQGFLQLLDRPIALIGDGKLEFGGYLGFGGFLTCGRKFALYAALYIGVFR